MKNKAASFLKHLITTIVTAIKSKSMVVKSKTSSLKTRLLLFNLLHHKKLVSSAINHKIHAIMGQDKNGKEVSSKALVLYRGDGKRESKEKDDSYLELYSPSFNERKLDDEGLDIYDQEEEIVNGTASVIDMVKGAKEGGGEEFSLEKEIDHVADVFIRRFHREMKMQKLESFKRYQEMLARGV